MTINSTLVKSIILPAFVGFIFAIFGNYIDSCNQHNREYTAEHEPRIVIIDYTNNGHDNRTLSNKEIFFNAAIRNAHITQMKLKVEQSKQGEPVYKMILFEGGGGGGGDMPQCYSASANIKKTTDEYILIDIPNSINRFRKENMPAPVFFNNDFDNYFYKISIHSEESSFEFTINTEIEWKGAYEDNSKNNDTKRYKIGPHKYFFLNPIELNSIIPANTKTIYVNGFSKFRQKVNTYFFERVKKERPIIVFTEKYQDKFIMIDSNRVFYLNDKHSHGEFFYFDERTQYFKISKT